MTLASSPLRTSGKQQVQLFSFKEKHLKAIKFTNTFPFLGIHFTQVYKMIKTQMLFVDVVFENKILEAVKMALFAS